MTVQKRAMIKLIVGRLTKFTYGHNNHYVILNVMLSEKSKIKIR